MKNYILLVGSAFTLSVSDLAGTEHSMRTLLLGDITVSLASALGGQTLCEESSRWNDLQAVLSERLGYHDAFDIKVGDVTEPCVSVKHKKIFVPAALNAEVDQEGVTPLTRYKIFQAFGREENKDKPFSYVVTRPRISSKFQKGAAWGFFAPGVLITLVGAGYLIDGALAMDPEQRANSYNTGLLCLNMGLLWTSIMGNRVLNVYGVDWYVSKESKLQDDAAYFAVQQSSKQELEAIEKDLNRKKCAIWRDVTVKSLIDERLLRLKIEERQTAA